MLTKIGLPILALGLIAFAVYYLSQTGTKIPEPPPPVQPAQNPFPNTVAGSGIIEPETENISVGAPLPGIVVEVMAKVGSRVKAGDPLFRIDDRELRAELAVRRSMLADANAALERLVAMPRTEELPSAEARIREAQADDANKQQQLERAERLRGTRAMSDEEVFTRKQESLQSRERYNKAKADLTLLKAGAWEYDKLVAKIAIERVRAHVQQTETEIKRLVVTALVDGDVLQVNVRPGEFVGATAGQALVVLGNVTQLHVRADIDEYDIPRFITNAPARATLKGQPADFYPLKFVRLEPYVVPKRSLTGDNTERVDTRVLQVIYAIDARGKRLFVGQQLDVFVDATPPPATTSNAAQAAL